MADWRVAVLNAIGAKPTKQNMQFLSTWQRWEGGHTKNDAKFNWLNTTRATGGSVRSINSVGVQAYKNFGAGIRATVETLQNGRYDDIVAGLMSGDPYKVDVGAGLQTWVSGRPDGNPGYAAKVLGRAAPSKPASPSRQAPAAAPAPAAQAQDDDGWGFTMNFVFGKKNPRFAEIMASMPPDFVPGDPGPTGSHEEHDHGNVPKFNGKALRPGTRWKGTHVTDGLDWNNGQRTAQDIMAKPGTAVLAPEAGRVIRHGSAQGGQALYFLGNSGQLYWLGHIDGMVPVGTKVKPGGKLAVISADHAAPHLHIDRYLGEDPGRYA